MPLSGRTSGRQISLGGSGDTKDKLLIGGLGLVIVAAIVGLVWSITGKHDIGPKIPDSFHLGCIACNKEWDISKDDYYARMRELGEHETGIPNFLCPFCKDARKTGFVMSQCPYADCGKYYFSNQVLRFIGKPTTEPQMCPVCKRDIMAGLRLKATKK
jgi:hypothetical protein